MNGRLALTLFQLALSAGRVAAAVLWSIAQPKGTIYVNYQPPTLHWDIGVFWTKTLCIYKVIVSCLEMKKYNGPIGVIKDRLFSSWDPGLNAVQASRSQDLDPQL